MAGERLIGGKGDLCNNLNSKDFKFKKKRNTIFSTGIVRLNKLRTKGPSELF